MGDAEAGEIALWTISTYVFDIWAFTPYQDVTSATKESGKTTLMECMALLMREPLVADNISPAAIYPAVAARKPTLLIDEGDTSLSKHSDSERIEAIRGVVNGGFRRTGNVVRCVGSQHEVAEFSTFCPKAFAGIGNFLSDTTRSRCVTIQLRKKRPSDRTEPFREHLYQPRSETLKREIAAWADSVDREALAKSYPATPDQLGARAADIWLPLLALADLAGGDWPARAHRAAITLSAGLDPRPGGRARSAPRRNPGRVRRVRHGRDLVRRPGREARRRRGVAVGAVVGREERSTEEGRLPMARERPASIRDPIEGHPHLRGHPQGLPARVVRGRLGPPPQPEPGLIRDIRDNPATMRVRAPSFCRDTTPLETPSAMPQSPMNKRMSRMSRIARGVREGTGFR